ncbi:MAG: MBL fold metallo-hydrolase [Minisyncoccia bacterium]
MKILGYGILVSIALAALFYGFNTFIYTEKQGDATMRTGTPQVQVLPLEHATAVILFDEVVIYIDPTGGPEAFVGQPSADLILLTDIHGDHLDPETLAAVLGEATLIAPQSVIDALPDELATRALLLGNGEVTTALDFEITGVPMYNLPGANEQFHEKGRGNGYILERDGYRLYLAGDTAGTPEMRALADIDLALIPMNLPYTMSVAEAAEAVLAFSTKEVVPYHYRNQDKTLADVLHFKELVEARTSEIRVTLLPWYPS